MVMLTAWQIEGIRIYIHDKQQGMTQALLTPHTKILWLHG
jgi:hypothetical protein